MYKYKDFYKFVKTLNPTICKLWELYNNAPDPKEEDVYQLRFYDDYNNLSLVKAKFVKLMFDPTFENGTAFIYYFKDEDGKEYQIKSINYVDDVDKLSFNDIDNLYAFWNKCYKINQ